MSALLALAATALRLVAPACSADATAPVVVIQRISECAGRVAQRGELVALGCFYETAPGLLFLDPRTPRSRVREVVVHERIHRSLYVCGGAWRDERLVVRLTRRALRR